MYGLERTIGASLFGYAVIYTAQVLFSRFYADLLHPQEVWTFSITSPASAS